MSNALQSSASRNLGLLLVRIPFGYVFAHAGWMKISGGIGEFVSHSTPLLPQFMPPGLGSAYLHAVPLAELLSGLLVLVGCFTRPVGAIQALMLISFTIAMRNNAQMWQMVLNQ